VIAFQHVWDSACNVTTAAYSKQLEGNCLEHVMNDEHQVHKPQAGPAISGVAATEAVECDWHISKPACE